MIREAKHISRRHLGLRIAVGVVLISLWILLTPRVIPELVFPSPRSVWGALASLRFALLEHASVTFVRVLGGWIIGTAAGVGFGLLMTWNRNVAAAASPIIEVVRPLPPVALIPFFILWFGIGPTGQITLIALGCFMVMVVNTVVAVYNLAPQYFRAASSLGASKLDVYRSVVIPGIMPSLVSGFRIAAALAFGVGVAAEFMGAQSGIGFMIMVARRTLNTNTILIGTLVIGLESYLVDRLIRARARRICRWADTPIEALDQLSARIPSVEASV